MRGYYLVIKNFIRISRRIVKVHAIPKKRVFRHCPEYGGLQSGKDRVKILYGCKKILS
jgi:hypothetical protein